MRTKTILVGAVGLAMLMVSTSCSSSDDKGGDNASAIQIAQVGAYSGVASAGARGQGIGLQAWVKYTNDNGGIDGRMIELTTADSKSDPTTEVSEVVRLATAKPVAFVGMGTFNMSASVPVLKSSGIPVVGGNVSDIVWNSSPNMYAQGTGIVGTIFGGFAAHPEGSTKFGLVYCKESPGCKQIYSTLFDHGIAEAAGTDPVYSAEVSLSAPSFAAQCIAAKQAGVEVMSAALTTPVLASLARQCAEQDFHPTYVFGATIASDELAKLPELDGAMSSVTDAPWFLEGGEMAAMREAMGKYQPDEPISGTTVEGWASGVVFGKAVENALAGDAGNDLTTDDIRAGLAKVQVGDFDGLTPPLSYVESGVQPPVNCYFEIKIVDGKWTAPNGDQPTCPGTEAAAAIDQAIEDIQ